MQHLKDLPVLILGLGSSGLAMARWCARHGARVTVADTRDNPPQRATLAAEWPEASFISGPLTADLVEGAAGIRTVYRSPGLAPAAVAPLLDAARALGLPVGGELDLFTRALADLAVEDLVGAIEPLAARTAYRPAVLAVTGTNGKTTVTALTGLLVERAGRTVAVAGNIGPTLLDTLSAHIDAATLPDVWVLELSSFQLADVCGFEPTAATVLNLSQDHLDWHGDMAAYTAAKANVFGATGLMVLNRDDAAVMALLPPPVKQRLQKPQQRQHVTFAAEAPRRPGDYGIETVNGMTWLVRAAEADETSAGMRSRRSDTGGGAELHIQRLMPADALRIRGRHNAVNALAALALAQAAGCALAPMLFGLREYRGEPHRVEAIALRDGVEFFDDSKGTNVGATVAALQGLGADRKLVVILGGEGKGQDFSPLALPVERHARAVVLIGRDAPLLREALTRTGTPLHDAGDMQAAVRIAAGLAQQGDAVLLSPACASFDMFSGYEHRAQVFCAEVRSLVEDGSPEAAKLDDNTDEGRVALTSAAGSRSGRDIS